MKSFAFAVRGVLKQRTVAYLLILTVIWFGWSRDSKRMALNAQDNKPSADEAGPSAANPGNTNAPANTAEGDQAIAAGAPFPAAPPNPDTGISLWYLAKEGGFFMYPIYLLSVLTIAVMVERAIALRRERVMPQSLIGALGQLAQNKSGFDPRRAYRLCQEHPSAASSVIRSMLLKVGRPQSEVEHAVKESSDREANRLYSNVRWLNLCASLSPLLGLIGTIQGMILAFHQTTVLPPGANKATALAGGIYTALVTTFAGLCVAIPASFAAHYFEGRIQNLFHEIDELLFSLLPQTERYEGRVRFSKQGDETDGEPATAAATVPPTPPPPPRQPAASPK